MFMQFETLPLDSPAPMIIYWIITFFFCLIMLMTDVKLLSKKVKTALYLITIFFAGFLLKGIPNVLVPIEFTLLTISERGAFLHVLHPIAIFSVIMGLPIIVGRIFVRMIAFMNSINAPALSVGCNFPVTKAGSFLIKKEQSLPNLSA